jgi:hypothetical protein
MTGNQTAVLLQAAIADPLSGLGQGGRRQLWLWGAQVYILGCRMRKWLY